MVGLFWSAWHYPAIIGGFYAKEVPLWASLPGFTLVLTGAFLGLIYIITAVICRGVQKQRKAPPD